MKQWNERTKHLEQARTKLKDKDSHTSRFTSLPSHPFESEFETKGRLLPTKNKITSLRTRMKQNDS
jgi:hypothetical protein